MSGQELRLFGKGRLSRGDEDTRCPKEWYTPRDTGGKEL